MTKRTTRGERLRAEAQRVASDPEYLNEVAAARADLLGANERLTITIADDDGFWSVWPAPGNHTLLGNTEYVGLCETMHEALREQWDAAGRPDIGAAP